MRIVAFCSKSYHVILLLSTIQRRFSISFKRNIIESDKVPDQSQIKSIYHFQNPSPLSDLCLCFFLYSKLVKNLNFPSYSEHVKQTKHRLWMELEQGNVYCTSCSDYVYDAELLVCMLTCWSILHCTGNRHLKNCNGNLYPIWLLVSCMWEGYFLLVCKIF